MRGSIAPELFVPMLRRVQTVTASSRPYRCLSTSSISRNDQKPSPEYKGPLTQTFRRLKFFSASSFALSATVAPFLFVVESNLPITARLALASIALGTSGLSTGLVAWCGHPYVSSLRYLTPQENGGAEGIEMTTFNLLLNPRITRVRLQPTCLPAQAIQLTHGPNLGL